MLPPSLQHHYSAFNTTTKQSAAIVSSQPEMSASFFTVLQSNNDFTRSDVPPVQVSCQLNPGRDTTSNPVAVVLSPGCKRNHPVFSPFCPFGASSLVHSRSAHLGRNCRGRFPRF